MKICFIDTVGLQFNSNSIETEGIGGSESAIICMSKELTKLGFHVTIYNKFEHMGTFIKNKKVMYRYPEGAPDPMKTIKEGDPLQIIGAFEEDGVTYKDLALIKDEQDTYDILISSRSVLPLAPEFLTNVIFEKYKYDITPFANINKNSKYKVIWLHDTFVYGEEYVETLLLDGHIHEIFTLSDWQTHYMSQSNHFNTPKRRYDVLKKFIYETRNGVNNYIEEVNLDEKDPNLFVYNSSMSKGMFPLLEIIWPLVKGQIPDAKLVIIGGYYKNLQPAGEIDESEIKYNAICAKYNNKLDIKFTGIITQQEIATILAKATYMLYPADFPETFGISTLEAINYNVLPITCNHGALEEVALDRVSYKINYEIGHDSTQPARFINQVVKAYNDAHLRTQKQYACNEVKPWITWDTIAMQWKHHFYNKFGLFLSLNDIERTREIVSNVNRIFKRRHLNPEEIIEYFEMKEEKEIIVITSVYNAENYIKTCMTSVAGQLYDNYMHIIIDDCSTDNSYEIIQETYKELPSYAQHRTLIFRNIKRFNSALATQMEAIKINVKSDASIIVLLDGDDWLMNDPDIFNYINDIYSNDIKFTYGSCYSLADRIELIAQPYPKEVRENKSYRQHLFPWGIPYTHLRTFSSELLDNLNEDLLKDENGEYFGPGGDGALFYALIEQCKPDEIRCIQRTLCVYNDANPINDYKINKELQNANAAKIRSIKPVIKVVEDSIEESVESDINMTDLHKVENLKLDIIKDVRNKDKTSLKTYKHLISERIDVWIDDMKGDCIEPRLNWLISKLQELNYPKTAKILDIGSWTGSIANEIYAEGYTDITCVDISKEVVRLGQQTFPYLKWLCFDIENTIPSETFDIIILGEVLEHLVDPIRTIHDMRGILNPNGVILYTIPTDEVVFGGTEGNIAIEHISKITKEELEKFTKDITTLSATLHNNETYKWWIGTIKNETLPVLTPINTVIVKPRILIAMTIAKYIESETFISIYNLEKPKDSIVDFQCFYGYNIAQVRNLASDYCIKNEYDFLMFVDYDIILPIDALTRLYYSNCDIVSGVYLQRNLVKKIPEIFKYSVPGKSLVHVDMNFINNGNEIETIGGCGFGCVLIKTDVLKTIGYPQFVYYNALDHNFTMSEDTDFCVKAFKKDYSIYCNKSVKCKHITKQYLEV
jgi:2-polyprenyl-3-methyl-5-hydroxy-6-metoxy-1,4-benzoquinol methylase/GT2 family glycosyltransferase